MAIDRSRWVAALHGLLLAGLVASFVARVERAWPDRLVIDHDTEEVLALADAVGESGGWLAPGHAVTPTRIRLGPVWHDEVAVARWLAGGDLRGAWRVLVALDLLGILAATAALRRVLGATGALAFAAVLLSDPLYVVEQAWPFWYQQHLVSWAAPATAAWVVVATSGAGAALLVAVALTGVVVQVHAMGWTLVPVGVVATWAARRRLTAGDVALALLASSVVAWPLVRQLPLLAQPDAWTPMIELRADPAVHGDPRGALWRMLTGLPGRITAGLVVVPVALAVAARRVGVRGVVLAWLAAGAAVFAATAHRWHVHYELVLILPLALAVGAAVTSLAARSAPLGLVAVVLLGVRPLLPFDWGFVPVQDVVVPTAGVASREGPSP